KTLLVTSNTKRYPTTLLRYIDIVLICDTKKIKSISNALNEFSDFSNVRGILTTNDFYVKQTAVVANKFKFPCIGLSCSRKCHFKGELRKALSRPEFSD